MDYHDDVVHHPLGGASYYFGSNLIQYISKQSSRDKIVVHLGAQPNSSPHIGNITTFTTGFALASALRILCSRNVTVKFLYVETAPSVNEEPVIDGVKYQRSLGETGGFDKNQTSFSQILNKLSSLSGIPCEVETQQFWRSNPQFPSILQSIIDKREVLGPHLSPKTDKLGLRAACPAPNCGLADKHGINNIYDKKGVITCICPVHGPHTVDLASQRDLDRLGFNTPLRNLIRITICSRDQERSWIMCTGSDYAGFYQEQLIWRLLERPLAAPLIFYAPLILDWSGSKLSKSMYVAHGAYKYLRGGGLRYMLELDNFMDAERGIEALYEEVTSWLAEPFRVFRSYSLEYMHKQLLKRGMRTSSDSS